VGSDGTEPRQVKFAASWWRAWLAIAVVLAILVMGSASSDAAGSLPASPEVTALSSQTASARTPIAETPTATATGTPLSEQTRTATAELVATSTPTPTPVIEQTATAAPPTEPAGQLVMDPTPTSTPRTEPTPKPRSTAIPTPAPKPVKASEDETQAPRDVEVVRIEIRSADGTVGPGGSIAYHFRVTNLTNFSVRFQLEASLDRAGWSVTIAEPEGPITLKPGQAHDVIVVVVAPDEALAGEQATLRLTVVNEAGVEIG
jgi:hypothetical protein